MMYDVCILDIGVEYIVELLLSYIDLDFDMVVW